MKIKDFSVKILIFPFQKVNVKAFTVKPIQVGSLQSSVFNNYQNARGSDTKRTLLDVTRHEAEESTLNPIAALHNQHHPGVHFRQPLEGTGIEY